jgi:uncharacterized protein
MLAATGLPVLAAAAGRRRRVGIIGGGMAGVSLAWLLDGVRDVVLLEAGGSIGGNVHAVELDVGGDPVVVDVGAQQFHPGPYPLYTALLVHLGLHAPEGTGPSDSHAFPASITLAAEHEPTPRFVSPALPGRAWPLLAPWNQAGVTAFAVCFLAAKRREQLGGRWALTLEDWLPTLGLPQAQWEGMLLPWAAALFSGSIDQARGLSARAAMIFAARALPANPLEGVRYYSLRSGMTEAMHRMLARCTTVEVFTGTRVQHVTRLPEGGFRLQGDRGRAFIVDDLVLAASGPGSLELLRHVPATGAQQAALRRIEFHYARIAIHTDAAYASTNPHHRSFLNCQVQSDHCESSMWLADVLPAAPQATAARLWKSWVTHREWQPSHVLYEAEFLHMLPTPATLAAQGALRALQGRDRIWFAGGYTLPYDSQETALRSALGVAIGLGATTSRALSLAPSWSAGQVQDDV